MKTTVKTGAGLRKNSSINKKTLLIFVLAFALLGGILIWRSFADTINTAYINAYTMYYPHSSSVNPVITDTGTASGYALKMDGNGTATATASPSSTITQISVRAKGGTV